MMNNKLILLVVVLVSIALGSMFSAAYFTEHNLKLKWEIMQLKMENNINYKYARLCDSVINDFSNAHPDFYKSLKNDSIYLCWKEKIGSIN